MSFSERAEWLLVSPIESDPDQFDAISSSYVEKHLGGCENVKAMKAVFEEYRSSHSGPDVETISIEGRSVAHSLGTLLNGYDDVGQVFTSARSNDSQRCPVSSAEQLAVVSGAIEHRP